MKFITKLKLAAIHQLCDAEDKSTEFMIEYMMDVCEVDHDYVMKYLKLPESEKRSLFRIVNNFLEMFEKINL